MVETKLLSLIRLVTPGLGHTRIAKLPVKPCPLPSSITSHRSQLPTWFEAIDPKETSDIRTNHYDNPHSNHQTSCRDGESVVVSRRSQGLPPVAQPDATHGAGAIALRSAGACGALDPNQPIQSGVHRSWELAVRPCPVRSFLRATSNSVTLFRAPFSNLCHKSERRAEKGRPRLARLKHSLDLKV